MTPWLECVPNVSEGRDRPLIDALGGAVEAAGARLVDVNSDADHHRSVFTYLGPMAVVEQATLALARLAVARIDLRAHQGVHPRIGAVDVIPFVPLRDASMRDAVAAAHRVGRAFAAETGVPVFFYGEAAAVPERRALHQLRRGGFESLAGRLGQPEWRPDAGPPGPHPTAGATAVGARRLLIAFNAVLDGADLGAARAIAAAVRESSGGLPAVQAMGVPLATRGLAQVSMNLVDYRRTPPAVVAARVEAEARRRGTRVREYELVGCAPADALAGWDDARAPLAGLKPTQLLAPDLFAAAA
jgi:glutamate formiminotransferase